MFGALRHGSLGSELVQRCVRAGHTENGTILIGVHLKLSLHLQSGRIHNDNAVRSPTPQTAIDLQKLGDGRGNVAQLPHVRILQIPESVMGPTVNDQIAGC